MGHSVAKPGGDYYDSRVLFANNGFAGRSLDIGLTKATPSMP